MTPEQKRLVKDSWARLLPMKDTAAELFYTRLFETCPEVRTYFKNDMQDQGRKLMVMLNTVVNAIDDLDPLLELLKKAGRAHRGYGVKIEDYPKVGEALLWTLEQGLGSAFSKDVRQAWIQTYDTIAQIMIEGSHH